MNTCAFVGRLTSNPELKTTTNGKSVSSFTLAVKRPRVADKTDFINCCAWNQSADYLCKYGSKGDLVEVSGTLQSRNYEDKNGNKRTAFDVVADSLSIVSGHSNTQAASSPAQEQNEKLVAFTSQLKDQGFEEIITDEDLPF